VELPRYPTSFLSMRASPWAPDKDEEERERKKEKNNES
jgi:hypothetical protein